MKDTCKKCRFKCGEKLSEDERMEIFNGYYKLADYALQREFICCHTIRKPKLRVTNTATTSRRTFSVTYFLPHNADKIRVCKTMFLNTLGINKGVVDITMAKRSSLNVFEGDKRGKHVKACYPSSVVQNVKSHIQSFPVVPSHYCREKTNRKYLDSSLNITQMYRLYGEFCDNHGEQKVSASMYRKIFNENFNLGFHNPKKDQCRVCNYYDNADNELKESLKDEHKLHLDQKERVRNEKRNDKLQAASSNGKLVCASFDLQQVLLVPYDPKNSALFYKRRLSTYNFTIYNMGSKQGNCFMWNETTGGRGSCEIASCIHVYLISLPTETAEVTFYSDRCGGQNLNKFVAAMFMITVQDVEHIEKIDHKFLLSGHSEMECDSMHSAINTELKRVGQASWPEEMVQIARNARRANDAPYLVNDLIQEQIKDYKSFVKQNMTSRKKDTDGNMISWSKIIWMRFLKSEPFKMAYKTSYDEDFHYVDFNKRNNKALRKPLQPLYRSPIPITTAKYNDLKSLFLLKPPALKDCYKPFYLGLPHNDKVIDESDVEDM